MLEQHKKILTGEEKPKFLENNLEKEIKEAYTILENCRLCERKCKINRKKRKGHCGVKDKIAISSAFPHFGEESVLVPSFTIFFMGCNFHCQYCQNYPISQWLEKGEKITIQGLKQLIKKSKKYKNVNFVGGEPTPHLPFILDALNRIKKETNEFVPVVWNSNMYMSLQSMDLLKKIVDVYLTDFKYGNNGCAKRLSKVDNYLKIIKRNHNIAEENAEILIRHLVLPNHFECCTKPILKWISKNLDNYVINIMNQYRPTYKAEKYEDINTHLTDEYQKAKNLANNLGLNLL